MDYNFDNLYNLPEPKAVKSAEQGRDIAIQWQQWAGDTDMSYGELAAWNDWFRELADKYPELLEEFEENGIL